VGENATKLLDAADFFAAAALPALAQDKASRSASRVDW
jgi:hypothetical protein